MTKDSDNKLRDTVAAAWPQAGEPAFDQAWQAAQKRHSASRRTVRRVASVAAVAAVAAIAMFGNTPNTQTYIEVAELMESTYWTAPSDSLLPEKRFDIYQEMPALFESTEPVGGTLL